MDAFHKPYSRAEFQRMLASLSGARAGERVLDAGCGSGGTLPWLAEAVGPGGLVAGVDVLPSLLAKAAEPRGAAPIHLVRADAESGLPFHDQTFDRVVCNNVLECLRDKPLFLRECRRVTRPGGVLLMAHFDFDSVVLASSHMRLTRGMVHGYADEQQPWMAAADGQLGRKLPGILLRAGMEPEAAGIVLFVERRLRGGYAEAMLADMRAAAARYGVAEDEAQRWWDDLLELDANGGFLFTIQWMHARCRA